jgi:hypothetical protein
MVATGSWHEISPANAPSQMLGQPIPRWFQVETGGGSKRGEALGGVRAIFFFATSPATEVLFITHKSVASAFLYAFVLDTERGRPRPGDIAVAKD